MKSSAPSEFSKNRITMKLLCLLLFLATALNCSAQPANTQGPCSPALVQVKVEGKITLSCGQGRKELLAIVEEVNRIREGQKLSTEQTKALIDSMNATLPALISAFNRMESKQGQILDGIKELLERSVRSQASVAAIESSVTPEKIKRFVPPPSGGINLDADSCQRDGGGRVACLLIVTNFNATTEFGIQFGTCCQIYDQRGNSARIVYAMIGNVGGPFSQHTGYVRSQLVQDVQTRVVITFESLPTGATQVKEMRLKLKIAGRFQDIAFRDVPILERSE